MQAVRDLPSKLGVDHRDKLVGLFTPLARTTEDRTTGYHSGDLMPLAGAVFRSNRRMFRVVYEKYQTLCSDGWTPQKVLVICGGNGGQAMLLTSL